MSDDAFPEPSRRDRLARSRHRHRALAVAAVVGALALGAGAVAVWAAGDDAARGESQPEADPTTPIADLDDLPRLSRLEADPEAPARRISHEDPLRLWVGGDSLAGSTGIALGELAGETGVVRTQLDYKVSSGLAHEGVRDWDERAAEQMDEHEPEAVVFVVGANDAPIVNGQDGDGDGVPDWEPGYRAAVAEMMDLFVGDSKHRAVLWVGAPTMRDESRDRDVVELNRVMREEAEARAPDVVYVDAYLLFSDDGGGYTPTLRTLSGDVERVRIGDGVHFTPAGAEHLARALLALLDERWHIARYADPSSPLRLHESEGSGMPGSGRRSGSSGSGSRSGRTATTAPSETIPPSATTAPSDTTPTTAPTTTAPPPPPTTAAPPPTTTAPPPPTTAGS